MNETLEAKSRLQAKSGIFDTYTMYVVVCMPFCAYTMACIRGYTLYVVDLTWADCYHAFYY